MSGSRKFRSIIVLLALASMLASALPAYAIPAGATAGVDIAEVLSGQQNTFVFTVTNTGAAGAELPPSDADPTIDWVRIGPATSGGDGTFIPESGAAGGWTPGLQDLDDDGVSDATVFRAGALEPTDSAQFTVVASAAAVATDEVVRWTVEVSDNNGANIKEATALGNLATTIRVLNVESVGVTAPNGVSSDGTATADQPNLVYESIVKNYGTADLLVDPSLTSNVAGDSITDAGDATIVSGDTHTFPFAVDLTSGTTSRTFTGDALATGADAFAADSPVLTVQNAPSFTYAANTLQPRAAVSGAVASFGLTVNKTNPPGVTFDTALTELTLTNQLDSAKTFSTGIATPGSVGTGNGSQALTFADVTIPGNPTTRDFDGTYVPSLRIEGADSNDAPFAQTVGVTNNFEIDNLIPHVDPNILAPGCPGANCQVDPNNVPTAKDGQTLSFSGPVNKGATAPDNVPDTTAAVTDCWLVVTDLANIELSRTAVPTGPTGCRNNAGQLAGGTVLATSGLTTGRAFVEVVVSDLAGNATPPTRSTGFVLIDNKAPEVAGAITGCGPNAAAGCVDLQTVRVNLSEPVSGDFQPFDFSMGDGNIVLTATETQCATPPAPNTKTFCKQVVLTLLESFGEDDAPTVEFAFLPVPPTRARPSDAVALTVADEVVETVDGIVPDLPTLQTVTQDGLDSNGDPVSNARPAQGGSFYTNQEAPTFNITGLAAEYTGIVAVETNGVDDFQAEPVLDASGDPIAPADRIIAECIASGATVSCAAEDIGGDGTYPLLVASRDREGNLSQGRTGPVAGLHARPGTLVIDNVAPNAQDFAPSGATALDVTFDEAVASGRQFAEDWVVREALANGKFERFTVSGVSGADTSRTVAVDDTDYAAGDADQVLYTFQGTADLRYQDRAGNYLGNFNVGPAAL